jgi:sodium/bile acid cotransporter 7
MKLDPFTLAVVATVGFATVLPCRGLVARDLAIATNVTISLLFCSYGARLPREVVRTGLLEWRLHLFVLCSTFLLFPLLGLGLTHLVGGFTTPSLRAAVLYLCIVPSTVQSSIALTSLAGGNVAAAVCSASLSSLVGVVATPALARVLHLVDAPSAGSLGPVIDISYQLLVPFAVGQLVRPKIRGWVDRQGKRWRLLDQGSIVLVVYTAFSAATVRGLWREVPARALLALVPLTVVLLSVALLLTWQCSRALGLKREDQIVAIFCGSKKSLASGVPLANVLFPPAAVGAMVLPLMLYHQLQLMGGAALAQRFAARRERTLGPDGAAAHD